MRIAVENRGLTFLGKGSSGRVGSPQIWPVGGVVLCFTKLEKFDGIINFVSCWLGGLERVCTTVVTWVTSTDTGGKVPFIGGEGSRGIIEWGGER